MAGRSHAWPVAAWLVVVLTGSSVAQGTRPEVTIDSGRLRGTTVGALPAGGAFLGIPFAAQPVGALRWREPQATPHWSGVRDATSWGPACMQRPSSWLPEMLGIRQMATRRGLPVAERVDSGFEPGESIAGNGMGPRRRQRGGLRRVAPLGVRLALAGIAVVSFNYRLGAFGFFAYPGLDAESAHQASGNYGHLDQIAALAWVQRNIARFGGDAARVTIAGQSSGSLDICNLMASPLARGLFEAAILESGTCVDSAFPRLHVMEASGEKLAKDLGVSAGPQALEQLRAIPADRILDAAARDDDVDLEPNIDKWVLPEQPAVTFAQGRQARVPVMVGTNEDEVSIFASALVGGNAYRPKTIAEYHSWLKRQFGGMAGEVFAAYPASRDEDVPRVFRTMFSDYDFAFSAWVLAKDTVQAGQPTYLYRFTYVGSGPFADLGAFHSEELMFLSGRYWTSWRPMPADAQLSRVMVGYWAHFIMNGDPNGAGLPRWQQFGKFGLAQVLGRRIRPQPVPREAAFGIFQRFLDFRLRKAAGE